MSRARRDNAAGRRSGRARTRATIARGARLIHRAPVEIRHEPATLTLLGVAIQLVRPAVIMPGDSVVVRNRHGEVVYAEQGPDWEMGLREYSEFVMVNPRPLTRRQRAKVVRRG